MRPIAIRLFENRTFGTTYGKGLRRSAVFNATAVLSADHSDVADLPHKYPDGTGKGNMYFWCENHE